MANITLGTFRDYWKNVSDWVKGIDVASKPKVSIPDGVALTGRNVEELIFVNAVALTDNAIKFTDVIDVSKYKSITFFAINTHNQAIVIYPQLNTQRAAYWNGSAFVSTTSDTLSIPSDATYQSRHVINNKWPQLLDKPLKQVRFVYQAPVAPTSGSLTIVGWGVIN